MFHFDFTYEEFPSELIGHIVYLFVGIAVGIVLVFLINIFAKKMSKSIENGILIISFATAFICLIASVIFKEANVSVNILSFFSSFIFAWLLTKKSSKEEFEETQHRIAKTTFRHMGDIKASVVSIKQYLKYLAEKNGDISKDDIYNLSGHISIMEKNIENISEDWKDLMSEKERNNYDKEEYNPEDTKIGIDETVSQPDASVLEKSLGKTS